jgi:hypothetical protein
MLSTYRTHCSSLTMLHSDGISAVVYYVEESWIPKRGCSAKLLHILMFINALVTDLNAENDLIR